MKLHTVLFCSLFALAVSPHAQAVVGDLTTQSTVVIATAYGDAIFTTNFTRPTGTGGFDPFLTIQANGTEQGYNTSARKGVFDTNREPQRNHEIQLKDLAKVQIGGVECYSFVIDINEPNSTDKSKISLDALKLYTTAQTKQTTTNVDALGIKRFDLDSLGDNYIKYNDLNSGSGQADIAFFIPTASFLAGPNAAKSTDYVYMYQQFGSNISANLTGTSQGGFEETAIGYGITPVPEASTLIPLTGILGLVFGTNLINRRRKAAAQSHEDAPSA
ncbi:MAG: hypothetical protein JWQ44_1840 [Chthoniobacter sp.]|jgi:hypothetical protein|nr:hypothetical protein [Chthoniobacter sp.]